jgi:hypothetical protein
MTTCKHKSPLLTKIFHKNPHLSTFSHDAHYKCHLSKVKRPKNKKLTKISELASKKTEIGGQFAESVRGENQDLSIKQEHTNGT